MGWRYTGSFIQEYFNPLTTGGLAPSLYSWGANSSGQLGLDDTSNRSSPVQIGNYSDWSLVATVNDAIVSTRSDRSMWTFGDNSYGQLGQGDIVSRSSPVQVGSLTTWQTFSNAQGYHFTAIKTDGTLWAWGYNAYGQLGQNDIVDRSSPVQVGSLTTWSSCSNGTFFSVAIKTNGSMWSCGVNSIGQLGQNIASSINRSSPVQIGALTTWSRVSCGGNHSVASKTDGTLWAWGSNAYGQLGINSQIDRSSPVQIGALTTWTKAECGGNFVVARRIDGSLWSWGQNSGGQLGLNRATSSNASSPIQIGTQVYWGDLISCGTSTAFVSTASGLLFEWGSAGSGALGNNTRTPNLSSPVQLGSLSSWVAVASGNNFSVAIINT